MDGSLAKEKRGRRQGNTSKELTLELYNSFPWSPGSSSPGEPRLFSIVGLMDVSFSKGEERQEAGKHQQRINSGVNSFPWSPGSSSPGERDSFP